MPLRYYHFSHTFITFFILRHSPIIASFFDLDAHISPLSFIIDDDELFIF